MWVSSSVCLVTSWISCHGATCVVRMCGDMVVEEYESRGMHGAF